ncbi:hypothetical protein C8Q76DRAFT_668224 [Earliella scabrosa]|nr:hypothetical protein C8Q76DRAFT_668224 [Earliella scabrosa]
MSTATQNTSEAERLKAEGNALFIKNDFKRAYAKYTEALKHDDKNATIYCNRAACSLGLNRYMDASTDARKATKLDEGYARAWARLATADMGLGTPHAAVDHWKRAIAALPEDRTPAQEKQWEQYKRDLAAAKAKVADLEGNRKLPQGAIPVRSESELPWNRAKALAPNLAAGQVWVTSAWILLYARKSWEAGVNKMKKLQKTELTGAVRFHGDLGALADLSNAVVADPRVFSISERKFWEMYESQVIFETTARTAWISSGAQEVIEEAPKRLEREGWQSVRPALSLTVRGWIMRGIMEDYLRDDAESAVQFFTSALDLLQWGNERFRNVSFEDKGAVFQPTFIRGVKCLRLDAFIKAYGQNPGANSKYPLSELLVAADELLAEVAGCPWPGVPKTVEDIGFWMAFQLYPAGHAHALRGYYYHHSGLLLRETTGMTQEVRDLFVLAAQEYRATEKYYPDDDVHNIWYLHCAFNLLYEAGAPIRVLLGYLDHLHERLPKMKRIWGGTNGRRGQRTDVALKEDLKLRDELHAAIASGQLREEELDNMMYKPGCAPLTE